MKLVPIESRGGNYMIALANIAYLRDDENGQTKIGMVGGDQLLVVGKMHEIAAIIAANSE